MSQHNVTRTRRQALAAPAWPSVTTPDQSTARRSAVAKSLGRISGSLDLRPARLRAARRPDSRFRNRVAFIQGREQIAAFLARKWAREPDYRLIKELCGFRENRMAMRVAYKWYDDASNWFRSYGNENSEFDEHSLMR